MSERVSLFLKLAVNCSRPENPTSKRRKIILYKIAFYFSSTIDEAYVWNYALSLYVKEIPTRFLECLNLKYGCRKLKSSLLSDSKLQPFKWQFCHEQSSNMSLNLFDFLEVPLNISCILFCMSKSRQRDHWHKYSREVQIHSFGSYIS